MSRPLKKNATYADLCAVPENFVAEILGGELYASPRPASPHSFAGSVLGAKLMSPFQFGENGPGGWWFLDEPELHFGADVLVPDVAAWRRERMPVVPSVAYFTLAPDWVCEVISPSTERIDRQKKQAIYAREGVRHLWFVDPLRQTLEVFSLESARWSLLAVHEGTKSVRAEPFDAVELALSDLWFE
jgi:Uma2 family endonuclease